MSAVIPLATCLLAASYANNLEPRLLMSVIAVDADPELEFDIAPVGDLF